MAAQQNGPALMKVTTAEGGDGGETITKKPAAIPQQLELTRSLASVSNIYSHYVADLWLAFAIDAKHTVKSLPLSENNRTWRAASCRAGSMNRTSSRDFQNSRVVVRKDLTQTIALTD